MPQTPTYGLPFEHPRDDLPGYTLDGGPAGDQPILAEAVETELQRVDGQLAAVEAELQQVKRPPAQSDFQPGAFTVLSGSGNPWGAGELVTGGDFQDCAVVAVAGPEGRLLIHFSACLGKAGSANSTLRLEPEVRLGSTVGAGAVVHSPAGTSGRHFIGITAHMANSSSTPRIAMGRTMMVDGLTPGQAVNVRLLHRATGNPGDDGGIDRRSLVVEPW